MMELQQIFSRLRKIACDLAELNERSMVACQALNMHGFKRLHRHHAKKFFCAGLEIGNAAVDYQLSAAVERPAGQVAPYAPANIRQHIESTIEALKPKLEELGQMNREFADVAGVSFPCAVDMQQRLFRLLLKLRRAHKRFNDSQWNFHDIYVYDCRLHDKMKGIEGDGAEG